MKAYYGSRISENMTKTPEGFLICLNVPIARTGVQQYLPYELGLNDREQGAYVNVIRTEEEVFSPATIASFEGKPVTDEHPPDDVSPENFTAFSNGHAQNVRRGTGEESDLLLADLFITSPKLIEAIENGRREVSCGYVCSYEQIDGDIYQRAIRGNHVAVVPAGRAGSRVAIKDSATEQTANERSTSPMKKTHSLFASIFSRAAKDMEPEELADAIEQLTNPEKDEEPAPAPAPAPQDEGEPILEKVMAAVTALTEKVDALAAKVEAKDEEPAPAPQDEDPLEKLAEELQAETPADEEAAQTIPADEMPEETADEETAPEAPAETLPENPIPGADRAIALGALTALRPVIASLPKDQRKAASDAAVAEIRKLMGKDSKAKANGYNAVNSIVKQAAKGAKANDAKAKDQSKLGKDIMAKRNPHYKK